MQEETKLNRPSPVTEWAQICSKSMHDHLAPKGFAKIRAGIWKGKLKSNIDYLSKEMVDASGKIAFGCVNHYKNRLKEYYKSASANNEAILIKTQEDLKELGFFSFNEKARLSKIIVELQAENALLAELLLEVDKITVQ